MAEFLANPEEKFSFWKRIVSKRGYKEVASFCDQEGKLRQIGFDLDDKANRSYEILKMLLLACVEEARQVREHKGMKESALVQVFLTTRLNAGILGENQTFLLTKEMQEWGFNYEMLESIGIQDAERRKIRITVAGNKIMDVWDEIEGVNYTINQNLYTHFGFRPIEGRSEMMGIVIQCWNIGLQHNEWMYLVPHVSTTRGLRKVSLLRVPLKELIENGGYTYDWFQKRNLSRIKVDTLYMVFFGNRVEGLVSDQSDLSYLKEKLQSREGIGERQRKRK
jgi:hypothetical protein